MQKRLAKRLALVAIVTMLFAGIVMSQEGTTGIPATPYSPTAGVPTAPNSPAAGYNYDVDITGVIPVGQEAVTVANLGTASADLTGFTLQVTGGDKFNLPATTLTPGSSETFNFGSGAPAAGAVYLKGNNNELPDASGTVSLVNKDGATVSRLTWLCNLKSPA